MFVIISNYLTNKLLNDAIRSTSCFRGKCFRDVINFCDKIEMLLNKDKYDK